MSSTFRAIPSVEAVLAELRVNGTSPHALALEAARTAIARAREAVREGATAPDLATISAEAEAIVAELARPSLRRVVNASGVILQTNLGRAPLSERAMAAMAEAARDYTNLEFDLAEGGRGSRHEHVRDLLRRTTGAEDGLAVNNNAAALLMALQVFARGAGGHRLARRGGGDRGPLPHSRRAAGERRAAGGGGYDEPDVRPATTRTPSPRRRPPSCGCIGRTSR